MEALKYYQARRAMNAALERIDRAVMKAKGEPLAAASLERLDLAGQLALQRMPLAGRFAVECLGLRASSCKRLAQAAHTLAGSSAGDARFTWKDPYDLLDEAWQSYEGAVRGILVNEAHAVQRIATLHWVLVQLVAMSVVLGKESPPGAWEAAKLCADLYVPHADREERAWAHGSLAELWLVRLADSSLSADQRKDYSDHAIHHAQELGRIYPAWGDEFPVKSTRRQFERYADWWGSPRFEDDLARRHRRRGVSWEGPSGLVETARRVVAVLARASAADGGASPGPAPGLSGSPGAPSPPAADGSSTPGPGAQVRRPRSVSPPRRGAARVRPAGAGRRPFFDIEMLPAGHGDCLWIEYGRGRATHRWLVDCGTQGTAKTLMARVAEVPAREQFLELFVMTHVDADHIGGALPFFRAVQQGLRFGDVWFNGWRQLSGQLGARQGEMFSTAIQDFALPWNVWREGTAIVVAGDAHELPVHELPGGMTLTLLSPTPAQFQKMAPVWTREMKRHGLEPGSRVDYGKFLKGTPSTSTDRDELAGARFSGDVAPANGTSIALLAEFEGASVLLGADAHAPVLVESIRKLLRQRGTERLELDAFKVAHHGSQGNLSRDLLELLDCSRYLVSTNGDHFFHPDREAIGRILKYGGTRPELYFNYKSRFNDVWARPDLQEKYEYVASYPEGEGRGITVPLFRS